MFLSSLRSLHFTVYWFNYITFHSQNRAYALDYSLLHSWCSNKLVIWILCSNWGITDILLVFSTFSDLNWCLGYVRTYFPILIWIRSLVVQTMVTSSVYRKTIGCLFVRVYRAMDDVKSHHRQKAKNVIIFLLKYFFSLQMIRSAYVAIWCSDM